MTIKHFEVGGLSWIIRVAKYNHKSPYNERKEMQQQKGQSEAGHEPRKLLKLENGRNQILAYSLQKKHSPVEPISDL